MFSMSAIERIKPMPRTAISCVAHLHNLCADVGVTALDGFNDRAQRDVVSAQFDGSTSTWYWRNKPPMLATSATPGTEFNWY